MPETGRIIEGWFDRKLSCGFVLLGSSSLSLIDQSAEPLTGRNVKIRLSPLTFKETLAAESWHSPDMKPVALKSDFAAQIDALLLERVVFGGYPEVVGSPKKEQLLLTLAGDYLLKDILNFGLVKTPEVIRKLLSLLAHQCGALVSVHELANAMGIARQTVERYLALLEDTYIIFRLPAFSTNPRKEITKSQKIFFWRTRNGSEIDLVVKTNSALAAYEIKWKAKRRATTAFTEDYKVPVTHISRTEIDAALKP